ncbi:hypothetical protein [Siphonobacter aquaeclarae]|uniref:DUF3828 domain-containing protein n=1 Tax=Siphonobacter aquaeclarae TaxID=563176 RepID=A0A1G9Q1D7_9BACT|nr:hypothetical protein [Siphonobacter aquaeclarae]SDM04743.1 hypothetical protein SAMN04488090_2422 [Siphonobacter aquaeclarae]
MKNILCLIALFQFCTASLAKGATGNSEAQLDTSKAVLSAIQHVFDTQKRILSKAYYRNSVKLSVPQKDRQSYKDSFINGKKCIVLDRWPIGKKVDWEKPDPIVELLEVEPAPDSQLKIRIGLPASGRVFTVLLTDRNGEWSVLSLKVVYV